MPLPGFIQYVLGKVLNLNLYVDPTVAQRKSQVVTLRSNHPLTREQLLQTSRTVLESFGLALVKDGELYRVLKQENAKQVAPRFLRNENDRNTPIGLRPVFRYVQLENTNVQDVQKTLKNLIGKQLAVYPQAKENALILYGQSSQVHQAVQAVELLDQPQMQGKQGRKVNLAFITPKKAAKKLGQILSSEGYATGSKSDEGPGAITIVPVPQSGSVVILSGNTALLGHAVRWLRQLDEPGQLSGKQGLFVYHVQNASASALARTVSKFYGGKGGTNPNRTQPGGLTLSGTGGSQTTQSQNSNTDNTGSFGSNAGAPGTGGSSGLNSSNAGNSGLASNTGITGSNSANTRNGQGEQPNAKQGPGAEPQVYGNKIVVNKATNSIIYRGSAQHFQQLRNLLQKLDRPQRQILIEVTIAEVTLKHAQETGVSWARGKLSLGNLAIKGGTLGGLGLNAAEQGLNFTVLNNSGEKRALLHALVTSNHARVLSRPRVMALNGRRAFINVGDAVPIITARQTTNAQVNGNSSLLQSIQYIDTGIILTVTPVIHGQGQIDLKIRQEVSNAQKTTTGVQKSPTIQKRTVQTILSAPNGGTAVLGGLIRNKQNTTETGVPVLRKIPLLGGLFRSKNQSNNRTDLLVLITPHILSRPNQLESVTNALKRRIPGIRPARP